MEDRDVRLVELPTVESGVPEAVGAISVLTGGEDCPFEIKRIYWIHGGRKDEVRGHHAHRTLWQLMVPLAGSFDVILSNGAESRMFRLASARQGLLVGPGYWRTIVVRSEGSVLMVAASAAYSEADYIRDYEEFLAFRKSLRGADELSRTDGRVRDA